MKLTTALRLTALASTLSMFTPSLASAAVQIDVLSSKPQLVTGEDALLKVSGTAAAPTVTVTVTVGKNDVSKAFSKDAAGNYVGLVTGLAPGANTLTVKAGADMATLMLVDHGINDTLFAGPQQKPFLCENEAFKLAKAKDATCAAPMVVEYQYEDKTGAMKPFDPKGTPSTDIATASINGKDVPVIVRVETGIINRAAYQIQMIYDPAGPLPTPTGNTDAGWNGKLFFDIAGGVGSGYHMGRSVGLQPAGLIQTQVLGMGYALAWASLAALTNQSNDVLAAETLAKVKEHFIEEFGSPRFTVVEGYAGGAMSANLVANSYPGLVDGIIAERNYVDTMTFLQPLYDCELLTNVFKTGTWQRTQMQAVAGAYWGYCVSNGTRFPLARPGSCDMAVKDANKAGLPRCTFQDDLVNVFGKDAKSGNARNPFDNRGIQYGLNALNAGTITMAQFIDINQRIGGHDADGKIVATRQTADDAAVKAAYATGRVNEMSNEGSIVYIDFRDYVDGDPFVRGDANVAVQDIVHSDIAKARLQKATGSVGNYVQVVAAPTPPGPAAAAGQPAPVPTLMPNNMVRPDVLALTDKWLSAVADDTSAKTMAQKIAADRPADAVDTCYPAAADGKSIDKVTDAAKCKTLFPSFSQPRLVAGAPATADVFKCALKPVDMKDYKTAPTADQLASLKKIFPAGVCDYSKPGVGQDQKLITWASFKGDGTFAGL